MASKDEVELKLVEIWKDLEMKLWSALEKNDEIEWDNIVLWDKLSKYKDNY